LNELYLKWFLFQTISDQEETEARLSHLKARFILERTPSHLYLAAPSSASVSFPESPRLNPSLSEVVFGVATHLHIGTSGWAYPHWQGHFYPRSIRAENRLSYYASQFDTVELNNSFYALPRPELLLRWKAAVPPDFCFAVKASREITHRRRLRNAGVPLVGLLRAVEVLDEKLGPILFQLPPGFPMDAPLLAEFLALLPRTLRCAFEFRDPGWWRQEVYDLLARHGIAFCLFDLAGKAAPLEMTADFAYVRLHGAIKAYHDRYPADVLRAWAEQVANWRSTGRDVYFYFDNTEKGDAAHDALELRRLLTADTLAI